MWEDRKICSSLAIKLSKDLLFIFIMWFVNKVIVLLHSILVYATMRCRISNLTLNLKSLFWPCSVVSSALKVSFQVSTCPVIWAEPLLNELLALSILDDHAFLKSVFSCFTTHIKFPTYVWLIKINKFKKRLIDYNWCFNIGWLSSF